MKRGSQIYATIGHDQSVSLNMFGDVIMKANESATKRRYWRLINFHYEMTWCHVTHTVPAGHSPWINRRCDY